MKWSFEVAISHQESEARNGILMIHTSQWYTRLSQFHQASEVRPVVTVLVAKCRGHTTDPFLGHMWSHPKPAPMRMKATTNAYEKRAMASNQFRIGYKNTTKTKEMVVCILTIHAL